MGDASGYAAFYRMAESIEVPGRAIFIVEIDAPDDALSATFDEGLGVTGIFIDRRGRSTSDPAGLLSGLAAFALPLDYRSRLSLWRVSRDARHAKCLARSRTERRADQS